MHTIAQYGTGIPGNAALPTETYFASIQCKRCRFLSGLPPQMVSKKETITGGLTKRIRGHDTVPVLRTENVQCPGTPFVRL
eukprot:scaffold40781_cov191-Amphora_coffeaeformis.AAC.1